MKIELTKEFWTNLVLFVVACVALGLSIWAINTPCKNEKFGEYARCGGPFGKKIYGSRNDHCFIPNLGNKRECPPHINMESQCVEGLKCVNVPGDDEGNCKSLDEGEIEPYCITPKHNLICK